MASLKFCALLTLCMASYGMALSSNSDHLVHYEDMLQAQKDNTTLIIDIREDFEVLETGKMPGSVHIPMKQVSDALTKLSSEEFEKQYLRKQPTFDTRIILSCRSGKRSGKLLPVILELGFKNTYSYDGGFNDWAQHQQDIDG